jgi:formate transporter
MSTEVRIDALLPAEMARRAEYLGVRKAEMPALKVFTLAILAGAFIALGAIFATTIWSGGMTIKGADGAAAFSIGLPYGVTRLLGGVAFCVGLILVVIGGAELFTGNNMIVMAWASRKVSTAALLRNWGIVYLGNFVGSVGTAVMLLVSQQYTFSDGAVGITALKIANSKAGLDFLPATFMASEAVVKAGLDLSGLTWGNFLLNNLLPVTIGNIIGGALLVAAVYWSVFLRGSDQ